MGRWSVDRQRRHDEPFGWWGYRAEPAEPRSIVELIERGSLDARLAAFLWLAIERRASLAVTAAPPQAGMVGRVFMVSPGSARQEAAHGR